MTFYLKLARNGSGADRSHVAVLIARVVLACGLLVFLPSPSRSESSTHLGPESGQAYEIPGLGLKLLPVAPGSFMMGDDNGKSDERPVTRVRISRSYWLGTTEVTQAQWEAIMGKNLSHFKGRTRPAENMGWAEAMEFGRKLTEREKAAGRLPAGYRYTLPTEAQWEYACRAGSAGDYPGEVEDLAWEVSNSDGETHPVAMKQPNPWGFYDMNGNVWEWCSDWYGFYPGGSATDPTGVADSSNHVNRGGSFWDHRAICRSSFRNGLGMLFQERNLGFRLALTPELQAANAHE